MTQRHRLLTHKDSSRTRRCTDASSFVPCYSPDQLVAVAVVVSATLAISVDCLLLVALLGGKNLSPRDTRV